MKNLEKTFEQILNQRQATTYIGYGKYPIQGQFVSTAMQVENNLIKKIGYCVQIRKKIGAWGSDAYILRHANGLLTIHENQSFYKLIEEEELLVRPFFEVLPEHEDFTLPYTLIGGTFPETGFIIEKEDMKEVPPTTPHTSAFIITTIK